MTSGKPLVGVISDRRVLGPHPFHVQGEKYLAAVAEGAGALPVGVPVLPGDFDVAALLARVDGLLLTGSPSNVEPARYGGPASAPGTLHDPHRDGPALALIPAAIAAGVPVFAVCRGFQELNVAFGGTLHQAVQDQPGLADHREDKAAHLDVQYGPAHPVRFTPGGLLARLTGATDTIVNSLHSQGIERLGAGLAVEATAPDGLIEAVTAVDAPGFVLGVQWHPEWRVRENPVSLALFAAFGDACRRHRHDT
jgi:putative glutamine amidotransferase